MDFLSVTRILAVVGLAVGVLGILVRIREIMSRPFKEDLARPQGSIFRGVLYAFTLGMAPWEKESTRIHWIVYLRGIFFHVGVFTAFGVLIISPWLGQLPVLVWWLALLIVGLGALAGYAGIVIRLAETNLRSLSIPDDYFSVFLTSTFVAAAFLALWIPATLPIFYLVTALLAIVVPFSKIRHCVYFFYAKFFFGLSFGNRGVIARSDRTYTEG